MKESAGPLAAAASSTTSELAIIEEVQADSPPLPAAGPAATNTNFEYEDSEWDVGIGNLIIDLDADIEKNGKNHPAAGMPSSTPVPSTNKSHKMAVTTPEPAGLKMKIKRTKPGPGTRSSETKHEIVKTDGTLVAGASPTNPTSPSSATINNNNIKKTTTTTATTPKAAVTVTPVGSPLRTAVTVTPVATAAAAALTNGSSAKSPPVTVTPVLVTSNGNNPVSPPPKKWKTGHLPSDKVPDPSPPPTVLAAAQPIPAATNRIGGVTLVAVTNPTLLVNGVHPAPTAASSSPTGSSTSGSGKADACVGTCSASTMTEPDCLGPCEPGTAVTLEGIVWHETEGGVLVVNVTWRGKTYVGTLMDCTKNEWAPPRLCDSPTSDAESRAPKGRAKRGRGASSGTPVLGGPTGDKGPAGLSGLMMMNDISPMHSKLRNGAKGRRGGGSSGGPPSSPAKEMLLLGAKRKSSSSSGPKPVETDAKRSRSSSRGASSPITTMDPATQVPAGSPSLIECPEPNCSKKYRHINGLKYHQSHAHSTDSASSSSGPMAVDEDSNTSDPPAKSEEAPETPTAPFTGKVPMPPPQEDSLSSPIKQQQQQPASTAPSPAPAGQPTTVIPEGQAVSADWTEAEQLKKKHKKKSKDKDRDRSAKKSVSPPPTPAVAAVPPTNGTTYPAATGPTSPVQPIVAAPPVVLPESREEVQSPAYSDISDANDQSPSASMMLDAAEDITKKEKMADLPVVVAAASAAAAAAPPAAALAATFGMYHPFYGQPPLTAPPKEPVRILEEVKAQQQQPLGPQQAPPGGNNVYQPFGFVPPYPAFQPPDADKKMVVPVVNKTDGSKPPPEKLPPPPPPQQQQQQMQQQQQQPAVSSYDQAAMMYQQHQRMQQQEADLRRFYNIYPAGGSSGEEQNPMFSPGGGPPSGWMVNGPKGSPLEQPRKPSSQPAKPSSASSPKLRPPSVDRKEKESKPAQFEGVKPTMETHGPPPPPGPTSMSPFHPGLPYPNMYNPYGLPFDPSHPAYRMLGPHGPPPPPTHHYRGYPPGPPQPPPGFQSEAHALEMFQHQYYAALAAGGGPSAGPPPSPQSAAAAAAAAAAGHKIHELTERAMKSPPASPASSKSGFPPPPPPPPPSSSSPFSSNPPSGSYLNNKPHLLRP